jgi:hypothetical protein
MDVMQKLRGKWRNACRRAQKLTHDSAMELVLSREAASIEKTGHASAVSEETAMIDELFLFGWLDDLILLSTLLTHLLPVIAGHETTATTLSCTAPLLPCPSPSSTKSLS